jgi:hypothetical protein
MSIAMTAVISILAPEVVQHQGDEHDDDRRKRVGLPVPTVIENGSDGQNEHRDPTENLEA